jgi:serine/threonine protein kinase
MITLIQKGSYGSIFYPSINVCNGTLENDIDSKHYITKIQKLEDANSEIEIGNIIKTIPYYTHFFSPIESSCTINTKSISYELIKKCKIMQNELSEFEKDNIYSSSKIRYVGKHTLDEYIKTLPNDTTKHTKIYNTHLHLLEALEKLLHHNIIHFDLKGDNIMFDDIQSIPIIIDFGISNVITPLLENTSPSKPHFFVDYYSYDYWCIDVFMMANIEHENQFYKQSIVTKQSLDLLLYNFKTPFFNRFLTEQEIRAFDRDYYIYFSKYANNNQTWQELFTDLLQFYKTWDNYSISMSYLRICKNHMKDTNPKLQEYIALLKTTIVSMPNKRMTPEAFRTQLLDILEKP